MHKKKSNLYDHPTNHYIDAISYISPPAASHGTWHSVWRQEEQCLHRLFPGSQRSRSQRQEQEGTVTNGPLSRSKPVSGAGQMPQGKEQVRKDYSQLLDSPNIRYTFDFPGKNDSGDQRDELTNVHSQ